MWIVKLQWGMRQCASVAYGDGAIAASRIGGDASFEERRAASERKLARERRWREASRHGLLTLTNTAQEKGPILAPSGGGGPALEGYCQAAARSTGNSDLAGLVDHIVGFTCKR